MGDTLTILGSSFQEQVACSANVQHQPRVPMAGLIWERLMTWTRALPLSKPRPNSSRQPTLTRTKLLVVVMELIVMLPPVLQPTQPQHLRPILSPDARQVCSQDKRSIVPTLRLTPTTETISCTPK